MDDLSGRNLGPYRVLERIGAGGMATVYKAYHAAMDRYVAIKVLPPHLARHADFHARFLREARTIARLEHRHILTVHDVAEVDGVPFLVMRYTNSGDLNGLIARRSLTVAQAARLIGQVASALAYAHRQGVVHRDVKPGNVLIGPDGDALLTDFGIAKIYEDTLNLTGEGQLVGTPAYMAPEQVQAQPVDARTDIYALGIVLYQALVGEPPFIAETPLALALMHIHNPLRPPRQVNPDIPEALERVVLRATAKAPGDRFQTADEMAAAIQAVLAGLSKETARIDQPAEATAAPLSAPPASPPSAPAAAPLSALPASQPASTPAPTPPAPASRRRLAPLWLGGGGIAVAAVALAALLLRPGATPSVTPSAAPAQTAAPAAAPAADLRFPAATSKISGLAVAPDAVWAATDGGLVRWNPDGSGRAFTSDDGLPFDEPGSVAVAKDGTLWVGGGGVAHIRPLADGIDVLAYYTKDDGLGAGVIRALLVDADGTVWAGGPQSGERFPLSHFNGTTWVTDELPTDDPALAGVELRIQSILRASDGSLWLGLQGGRLLRWDGKSWASFGPDEGVGTGADGDDIRIRRLAQASDETIWAAGSKLGLLRFNADQGRWERVTVRSDDEIIRGVAQFADGSLWAAGDGLVARSTDSGQTWAEVQAPDGGIGDDIGSLAQDAGGRVWAGAYEGGLSVFDGSQWRPLQR
jgi:serine/threonine protein kinase